MNYLVLLSVVLLPLLPGSSRAQAAPAGLPQLQSIIGEIQQLENISDPKCYATAARLEDFIYGTPLTDAARFRKNELQKQLIRTIWQKAAGIARIDARSEIFSRDIDWVLAGIMAYRQLPDGDWEITREDGALLIPAADKRQYSSIAYALRALLAVQQEMLLVTDEKLPRLETEAIRTVKNFVDLYTLAALKLADTRARLENRYELSDNDMEQAWAQLASVQPTVADTPPPSAPAVSARQAGAVTADEDDRHRADFTVLKQIIEQKVSSYAAYNHISNPIFLRNLQVYFARLAWPADPQTAEDFKALFVETMVYFAAQLYLGAEAIAREQQHPLIRVEDVKHYADFFIPHKINEYEDALFFPKLPAEQRIFIESYDMDAFRDSGLHWRYLQFALEQPDFAATLEPDPFAAELLVENIAQFGVLALRSAGIVGKQENAEYLQARYLEQGLQLIQSRIDASSRAEEDAPPDDTLHSSVSDTATTSDTPFFQDITADTGIDLQHRSSDWLNRLLRSYLPGSDKNTGNITIPPAFGGSGVAAEDINNDDLPDILLLSGQGNRLYLNTGDGHFSDITAESGIDWRRPQDNLPGEPRQPLIADFDNDGLRDIMITYVDDDHRLYKNLGNGGFEDVTAQASLGGKGLVGGPATVFDYDRDGLPDIYIAYFGDYIHGVLPTLRRRNINGLPNKLFRNQGDMRFADVTSASGVDNSGWGQAVSHTDLDGDGWQDLIVGNDFGINAYYRNQGDGTFEDISERLGTGKPSYTMNIGIADLNDDSYPDIYISNIVTMNKDEKYVLPAEDTVMKFNPEKLANQRIVEANDLFLSGIGSDGLRYVLSDRVGRGYSSTGWSWDADFFDFDNDGDDDLYVLNGMNEFAVYSSENPYYTDPNDNREKNIVMPVAEKESNVFFVNDGGRLNNVSRESGVDFSGNSRSAAYLDFDRDGDLDIIVNNYHGQAMFFKNNTDQRRSNGWLSVRLQGDPAQQVNRDAIGARLIATTPSGNRIWREVHGSIGYLSVHPKEQHFGLGTEDTADLRVEWPNGKVSSFRQLATGHRYLIDQAEDSIHTLSTGQ